LADTYLSGGRTHLSSQDVAGTTDPELYRTQRTGLTQIKVPGIIQGTYRVTLHLAETEASGERERVFSVAAEGKIERSSLDIYDEAGRNKAYDTSFLTTVIDGMLDVRFDAIRGEPTLAAFTVAPKTISTASTGETSVTATRWTGGNWKLTLPIDTSRKGSPDEITQPALARFSLSPYYRISATGDGVVFRAPVGGATTSGTDYPRSELREMKDNGAGRASWPTTSGKHAMVVRQAITHVPAIKPHVTAAQIHNGDDVIVIRLEGKRLFADHDGENLGDLDTDYELGTPYTVALVASDGRIRVSFNGEPKVDYAVETTGNYFKVGAYTQSNPSRGDLADDYGEVEVYDVKVSHACPVHRGLDGFLRRLFRIEDACRAGT